MSAHQFARNQLAHFNALADSSQLARFISDMRLVEQFGNYAIANRARFAAEDAAAGRECGQ